MALTGLWLGIELNNSKVKLSILPMLFEAVAGIIGACPFAIPTVKAITQNFIAFFKIISSLIFQLWHNLRLIFENSMKSTL